MGRKKWRLKTIPAFVYESAPSMKQAFDRVEEYRHMYANGAGRVHHVNVEVDEGNGWELYERIVFPPRALS